VKKFVFSAIVLATAISTSPAKAGPTGTSVDGDEAREVYNSLIAAGATRIDGDLGPEVVIDQLNCTQLASGSTCVFQGDPALSTSSGATIDRLVKALVGVGVKAKAPDANTKTYDLSGLDCGILHNPPQSNSVKPTDDQETASCYFVDNNNQ
jgi:hypothetical protein